MRKLTVGSCFAGIGGIELGLERAGGFETRWQIEKDPYATAVLARHWPNVARFGDIRTVDASQLERVDLICGGYPCQPFSLAGKRAGEEDERHLWPEMLRIIRGVRPRLVLLENVPGHLSMGFGRVLGDLAESGFDAEWGLLSAAGVGAPHLRRRVFVVAYAEGIGVKGRLQPIEGIEDNPAVASSHGEESLLADAECSEWRTRRAERCAVERQRSVQERKEDSGGIGVGGPSMANAQRGGCDGWTGELGEGRWRESPNGDWWAIEPDVGRVAHGIPSRVDRLRCLGNAVVPQVAKKVGEMILALEAENPRIRNGRVSRSASQSQRGSSGDLL